MQAFFLIGVENSRKLGSIGYILISILLCVVCIRMFGFFFRLQRFILFRIKLILDAVVIRFQDYFYSDLANSVQNHRGNDSCANRC